MSCESTFEVKAADAEEPGAGRDSFAITVTSRSGEVVASLSGLLAGGNIQSKRVKPVTPAAARAGR